MTDMSSPAATPPAGYYPDPAGGPRRRWWDGTSWTEHLEQSAPMTAPPYTVDAGGRPIQPQLPEGTKVNTAWAWAFALMPLIGLASSVFFLTTTDLEQYFRDAMARRNELFPAPDPHELLSNAISWTTYGVSVLFAFLDHRTLTRRGVVRPFHWAWAFLFTIPYIIGRGVVLHRRVRRGLAPMWVYLALTVVGLVTGVVFMVMVWPTMMDVAFSQSRL